VGLCTAGSRQFRVESFNGEDALTTDTSFLSSLDYSSCHSDLTISIPSHLSLLFASPDRHNHHYSPPPSPLHTYTCRSPPLWHTTPHHTTPHHTFHVLVAITLPAPGRRRRVVQPGPSPRQRHLDAAQWRLLTLARHADPQRVLGDSQSEKRRGARVSVLFDTQLGLLLAAETSYLGSFAQFSIWAPPWTRLCG
jgi:hypothetical protein